MAQSVEIEPHREYFRKQVYDFAATITDLNTQITEGSKDERLKLMGLMWKSARRDDGTSIVQLSKITGFPEEDIKLFEDGKKDPREISDNFIENIAMVLEKPFMMAMHLAIFEPDKIKPHNI